MIEPCEGYGRNDVEEQSGVDVAVARYGDEYLACDGMEHEEGC